MPKVPERPLSPGEILNQNRKPVYQLSGQEKQELRYWRAKKSPKKTKLQDKGLIAEDIARRNHFNSIRDEN